MSCNHHSPASTNQRRLATAFALSLGYMGVELAGGLWSGSLALLADAGHMFSDAAALGLSLAAAWIAARPATPQRTFGYVRAEILAAAANGALLIGVAVGIAWEAWERLHVTRDIDVPVMAGVAAGGLAVNLLMLRVLHGGHTHNLNVRGAWLHVIADALGSVAVLLAAGAVALGWGWADPTASVLIAGLVVHSAWRLLRDALGVLMEHSPSSIEVEHVRGALLATEGVTGVHCLHVWSIASGFHAISAHVVLDSGRDGTGDLAEIRRRLQQEFHVDHVTLQLEPAGFDGCDEAIEQTCRPNPTPQCDPGLAPAADPPGC